MTHVLPYQPDVKANICLILEGTYPFIRGGVSTWVRQLIEGMPDLSFSIIFLGSKSGENDTLAYELPDNVVHIEVHYLLEENAQEPSGSNKKRDSSKLKSKYALNGELHDRLSEHEGVLNREVMESFTQVLIGEGAISKEDFSHSKLAWNSIREKYSNAPGGLDFNHYFWTVRGMHAPLFTLAKAASNAPDADVYHSVSTGYAGFLGAMVSKKNAKPYLITEHGIYTKERELDLAQVNWIPDELDPFKVGLYDEMSYLRQVWIRFFASLGRLAYSSADKIFTLYEGNRQRQLRDGAPDNKLFIVPNGVDVTRYSGVRRQANATPPPVVALIGRVVPIKDIKTFIRAMRIIRATIPDAEGWLIGPQDEDPDYTTECIQLVESLDLKDCVKFLGFQNTLELLPQIGLSVLTSVSEGQPLVLLEGFAAGVPTVATDVGSCSELVYGVNDEDKALGSAGAVVPLSDPAAFASEAIALLSDSEKWQSASTAGIARVEQYYDEKTMIERYRAEYTSAISNSTQYREAS